MHSSLPVVSIILLSIVIPAMVLGQCCTVPNGDPYIDEIISWDGLDVIDDEVTYNGTLVVDGHMRIINSTVTFEGKGLVLNSSGTLEVVNSVITSHDTSHGYYLDLMGDSSFENVTLDGCIDMENGYFGLYVEDCLLQGKDLTMARSGMIRLDGGNIDLEGSIINGIMSYSGNMTMRDTLIELTGVTQYGPGAVDLSGVTVTSNMSFSQTAGISSFSQGDIILDDVTINGSFNAGVSSVLSSMRINNTLIDLEGGIFGIRGTDSELLKANYITVKGTGTGVDLKNCSVTEPISHSFFNNSDFGLIFQGNNPVDVFSTTVKDSSYGMVSSAPLSMKDVDLVNNKVGLLIEDGSVVEMTNCSFIEFTHWAIEDETWQQDQYQNNEFIPSDSSMGTIAWWGWITLEILGPENIPVTGSEVTINSSLGSSMQVQGPDVGVIWGYLDLEDEVNMVDYIVKANWGTATEELSFFPSHDRDVKITLPLTDIVVTDLYYEDGMAVATLLCNGSQANEVTIEIFIDGASWNTSRTTLNTGEEKTVYIELIELKPGEYNLSTEVSSNDEYSGTDGYLQHNNALSYSLVVERGDDDGLTNLLLFGLVILAVTSLIVMILFQRRD